ncbi:MAG: hypothetical protein FWB86_01165 [Treponema sp.]|nr:hypothetical protein [Treponema sp.]MCL2250708.1 hypothetical protein [Treponema sp.]
MTLTVEIINTNALNLLSEMERLDLIRLNTQNRTTTVNSDKLSNQFAGTLKLTDAQYETYQNNLLENRNEWERNIY